MKFFKRTPFTIAFWRFQYFTSYLVRSISAQSNQDCCKRLGSHILFTFDKSPSINQMILQNWFVSAFCTLSRNVLSFATLSESTLIIRMQGRSSRLFCIFLTSMISMNYILFPTTRDCAISCFKIAFKFMSTNTISRYFQSYILDRFASTLIWWNLSAVVRKF